MGTDQTAKDTAIINDVLVNLFNEIMDIEQKAIITEEFSDITNNDMHIIDAIGTEEPQNMSAIARKLSVTMGTLTTSMNQLVKKEYVVRSRSEKDRRVVYIHLTERGERAYHHHAQFHHQMVEAALSGLNPEELTTVAGLLLRLKEFFLSYKG